MKRAMAVIGANAGDEGKGKMVDYFASKLPNPKVVVRFNSGAQCGHTVVTPDKRRHIFGHFGAGTFTGAHTYLAKHFVCNPILFWHEGHQLFDKLDGTTPIIAADPRCFITTPYDMLINQAVESHRGSGRHGSTGIGFGETIERNNYPGFTLWKKDLDSSRLADKVRLIRDRWMPARLKALRVPNPQNSSSHLSDETLDKFVAAATAFGKTVPSAGLEFLSGKEIIFEGGQGLLLDQNNKDWFPHVTRSSTGVTNIVPIAKALGLRLDIVYVSRTYLTRHGAGPLPGEFTPDPPIRDDTNMDHPFQGKLRFGTLNPDQQRTRIEADLKQAPGATWRLALTCLDHPHGLKLETLSHVGFLSSGADRDSVKELPH